MTFLDDPEFWREWMTSAGFGGAIAAIAAMIAFVGVLLNVRSQQKLAHKEQWWERAKWALDNWVSDDERRRKTGKLVAEALSTSEYAKVHEATLLDAMVEPRLEQLRATAETPTVGESTANTSEEVARGGGLAGQQEH